MAGFYITYITYVSNGMATFRISWKILFSYVSKMEQGICQGAGCEPEDPPKKFISDSTAVYFNC